MARRAVVKEMVKTLYQCISKVCHQGAHEETKKMRRGATLCNQRRR